MAENFEGKEIIMKSVFIVLGSPINCVYRRKAVQMKRTGFLAVLSIFTLTALMAPIAWAKPPINVPIFEVFDDVNPCTGEIMTLTFTGVARIIENQDNSILVGRGTVETSDGFSGSFNRQFVINGDRVFHLRFHDMEASDETGQRIMFGVGMIHETTVDGDIVVSFLQFSGLRCVGPPAVV